MKNSKVNAWKIMFWVLASLVFGLTVYSFPEIIIFEPLTLTGIALYDGIIVSLVIGSLSGSYYLGKAYIKPESTMGWIVCALLTFYTIMTAIIVLILCFAGSHIDITGLFIVSAILSVVCVIFFFIAYIIGLGITKEREGMK